MNIPRQVRIVLGAVFVGGLAATLVAGLIWAYTPEGRGGLEFRPDSVPLDDGAGGEDGEPEGEPATTGDGDGGGEPTGDANADAEPTPTPTPTEDTDELITAAADPENTTVQVLDAGGGSHTTQRAVSALTSLGYQVINVTSSRTDVEQTTIWYTSGNEPEARALRARDERFAMVGPNERLNEGTNLHVLVGPDWEG